MESTPSPANAKILGKAKPVKRSRMDALLSHATPLQEMVTARLILRALPVINARAKRVIMAQTVKKSLLR